MCRALVYLNGKSLYINLSLYRYENMEGDFVYVSVINLKIKSWQI